MLIKLTRLVDAKIPGFWKDLKNLLWFWKGHLSHRKRERADRPRSINKTAGGKNGIGSAFDDFSKKSSTDLLMQFLEG